MTLHPHNCNKPDHFIEEYQRILNGKRVNRMLEIGVQTGNSLRMWADAFPEAEILGLDIQPMVGLVPTNVKFINGDQTDTKLLKSLGRFDLIVDDGSHMTSHQQISFETLWPQLNPGGAYVIEDIETPRRKEFIDSPLTTMEYLKEKLSPVQVSNHQEFLFVHEGIKRLSFVKDMAIIEKA